MPFDINLYLLFIHSITSFHISKTIFEFIDITFLIKRIENNVELY